ncbi:hypothetical protein [Tengunoibacter tsumagoiensis]|uniref:Uncharacterized protein n=1 Tax=Tengunoibacter tsumagoiensis TaxID=2014871 RepID=A0A402A4Z3_9CHLR|nr:hypothetical protein [Tengunoibacter tsumagoiensis]GCE14172.1 hypothetical protein KTT_40310 [Tengunoibacter tsumagoiensis]GCE14226.1 hypothetical protein KTT_40850 [Tengunoibacter tsumagoiensis]
MAAFTPFISSQSFLLASSILRLPAKASASAESKRRTTHIDNLTNVQIDALIDKHLFFNMYGAGAPSYSSSMENALMIINAFSLRPAHDRTTLSLFLAVDLPRPGSPMYALLSLVTPRIIAVAALKTVGVVDSYGIIGIDLEEYV